MLKKLMMLCVAAMAATGAWAATETVDGIEWNYEVRCGKTCVSVICRDWSSPAVSTATTGAITIPSTLGGDPVVRIDNYAFMNCSGLTSVTIPNSVSTIGWRAFENCASLTTVKIPDNINTIEGGAFKNCFLV